MNTNLVLGLQRLSQAGGKASLKDLGLNHTQWDNFQKLKYWGLVRQSYENGVRCRGVWEITRLGRNFLAGFAQVNRFVWTFRDQPVDFEGPQFYVTDVG